MRKYRVLIIEDDAMVSHINRQYVEKLVEQTAIETVSTLAAAKQKIAEKELWDLLLLDNYLADGQGVTLLKYIEQKATKYPVIFLSAANDPVIIQEALTYGVIDYLIKPYDFERFAIAMTKWEGQMKVADKQKLDQHDLDLIFISSQYQPEATEQAPELLPKGLANATAQRIYEGARLLQEDFSIQELAQTVGLSRTSTKKYADYFVEKKIFATKLHYLAVGHPLTKYSITSMGPTLMRMFH